MARRGRKLAAALAVCAVVGGSLAVAGCGDDGDDSSSGAGGGLSGSISIDGSSTVEPLSSAAAEAFNGENSGVNISVGTSGTGGGFAVFCKGEIDIADASRAIKDEEAAACEKAGVDFETFRVASDGITLVTGKETDVGGDNLTIDQLAAIWGPDSTIKNWDQVPPAGSFSARAMALAGPDSQSGTYDFFNEEVLGEDDAGAQISPRQDYTASADDNVIVRAVQSAPGTLGYFGYTYYEENADTLKAFSVDGVAPSAETITDGTYPLSRPLFIYVSKRSLERPEVTAFVRYYLENAVRLAEETEYVPAPQDALDESLAKLGD